MQITPSPVAKGKVSAFAKDSPERATRQATATNSAHVAQKIGKTKAGVAGAVGSNAVSKGVGA